MKYLLSWVLSPALPSLPTRGGWIEMATTDEADEKVTVSLPTRGGWIEIPCRRCHTPRQRSLPTRGGWIEISWQGRNPHPGKRPSPHGEGGLKFRFGMYLRLGQQSPSPHGEGGLKLQHYRAGRRCDGASLPTRGGWIEIAVGCYRCLQQGRSLPTRGGWIEISRRCGSSAGIWCPSPHGEGGLKSTAPTP